MRKKTATTAQRLAKRVEGIKQAGQNVSTVRRHRCESFENSQTGNPGLRLLYPKSGDPWVIDISFLLNFPNLVGLFSIAMLNYGLPCAQRTRIEVKRTLEAGLFSYLKLNHLTQIKPTELDDNFFSKLNVFLRSQRTGKNELIASNTVGQRLGAIRYVLNSIKEEPYVGVAREIAHRVPSRPAGASLGVKPTEIIPLPDMLRIIDAAESEISDTLDRFNLAPRHIASGKKALTALNEENMRLGDFSLKIVLAKLSELYSGVIPKLEIISKTDPKLAQAIKDVHGHLYCQSFFHPSPRMLVPFAVLISIATFFNPDTALAVARKDIQYTEILGKTVVRMTAPKGRAHEDPTVIIDADAAEESKFGFKHLLEGLDRITLRIRPHARNIDSDCIFLFVPIGGRECRSFGGLDKATYGPSSDITWQHSLKRFIEKNNLADFRLGQLRPTMLELVQTVGGSVELAQRAGKHKNVMTTWTHYSGDSIRKAYRETIGGIMLLRERWWLTDGAIDPRATLPSQDKGAATPGFSCLDPFDSPRPNQTKGRLCKDYGGCPNCPLAAGHPYDPASVSYYQGLEKSIYSSQGAMTVSTWISRWVPVLADLRSLLDLVPPEILKAASQTPVRLPKVG